MTMAATFAIVFMFLFANRVTPKSLFRTTGRRTFFLRGGASAENAQPGPTEDLSTKHGELSSLLGKYPVTACSIRGLRGYMEDEFVVAPDFAAVFDGHGGRKVSKYLRQNLYAELQATLPQVVASNDESSVEEYQRALQLALEKVDSQVQKISHWSYQGSTAVAVWLHHEEKKTTIITANIGDSRAVLSRDGTAIDLSIDHKPDSPEESGRIIQLGGTVDWFGHVDTKGRPIEGTGLYRVNGNLALSRAIGDRSERPFVTAEPDITLTPVENEDEFIVIATDGLWDAFTSQDCVTLIKAIMESPHDVDIDDIPKILTAQALKYGSSDNITILIVWLKQTFEKKSA